MIYYASKVFWLIAAPTNALVLISAIAAFWAALRNPNRVAWLAAAVACGLVIGTFTPMGLMLTVPLEYRFTPSDSRAPPDGIILLGGVGIAGIVTAVALSQDYPKARLIFSGFRATSFASRIFAQLGGAEDAFYSAALIRPKPSERWMLVTSALHMPRAVGCFRVAGFQVEPYPVEFTNPFAGFTPGSEGLVHLDMIAKEWIGLIAYRLMGKTDALFPGP